MQQAQHSDDTGTGRRARDTPALLDPNMIVSIMSDYRQRQVLHHPQPTPCHAMPSPPTHRCPLPPTLAPLTRAPAPFAALSAAAPVPAAFALLLSLLPAPTACALPTPPTVTLPAMPPSATPTSAPAAPPASLGRLRSAASRDCEERGREGRWEGVSECVGCHVSRMSGAGTLLRFDG